MHDIFRDGAEFIRRNFRRTILTARLSDERQRLERFLSDLGRKAWELGISTCESVPTGKELGKIQKKIDKLEQRTDSDTGNLDAQIREIEGKALEEEERFRDINTRREGAIGQKTQRAKTISEIRKKLQELADKRERLKDDLKFCSDKHRQLESNGPKASGAGESAAELLATEEALNNQSKEVAGQIKALQNRLRYNERAMSPLEQTIAAILEDLEASRAQRRLLQDQMKELRARLHELRNNAAHQRNPLLKERRALYGGLGIELLSNRSDEPELGPLFSAADLSVSTVRGLEKDIEAEKQLIGLLDQTAVTMFIGVLFGAGLLMFMVFALIITLILVL